MSPKPSSGEDLALATVFQHPHPTLFYRAPIQRKPNLARTCTGHDPACPSPCLRPRQTCFQHAVRYSQLLYHIPRLSDPLQRNAVLPAVVHDFFRKQATSHVLNRSTALTFSQPYHADKAFNNATAPIVRTQPYAKLATFLANPGVYRSHAPLRHDSSDHRIHAFLEILLRGQPARMSVANRYKSFPLLICFGPCICRPARLSWLQIATLSQSVPHRHLPGAATAVRFHLLRPTLDARVRRSPRSAIACLINTYWTASKYYCSNLPHSCRPALPPASKPQRRASHQGLMMSLCSS